MSSVSEFINAVKENYLGANIVYPSNLGPHRVVMQFRKYSYNGPGEPIGEGSGDVIELPLPTNLVDNQAVSVSGTEIGVFGSAISELAKTKSGGEVSDLLNSLDEQIQGAASNAGKGLANLVSGKTEGLFTALSQGVDTASFLARAGLSAIAPSGEQGFSAARGTAVNPFATLVFSGVPLKNFTFDWTFSPETRSDSDNLQEVIRIIRKNILPSYQSATGIDTDISTIKRGLLKYPSVVDITFLGIDQKYYFKLKTAMIVSITTNYTPNGLAILSGGKPADITLSMTITEAQIHTAEDYSTSSIDFTGFGGLAETILGTENGDDEPDNGVGTTGDESPTSEAQDGIGTDG